MGSKDDKAQLLQNMQDLMLKVGTAAQKALVFADKALNIEPANAKVDGPTCKIVELGVGALRVGTEAARAAVDLGERCIEIYEAIEEIYGPEEK